MVSSSLYPPQAIPGDERGIHLRVADWLCLAAAPTFAVMALMTATGGQPQWLCAAAHLGSPLSGMVPMYLLMSAFHTGPWLRLISGRRS